MICIDPSMGWFGTVGVSSVDKTSTYLSQLFNQTWLCRYPRSKQVRFYNGYELKNNCIPLLKALAVRHKSTSIKKI